MSWAPLNRRLNGLGPDGTIHDGIPAYLRGLLDRWVYDCDSNDQYDNHLMWNTVKLRLRLDEYPHAAHLTDDDLLDLIDSLLAWHFQPQDSAVHDLDELLTAGGAGWRINATRSGLERRIDATATAAAVHAIRSASDEAADHLQTAWTAAYGRNPDPDKAYDAAVLAVEAVACPLVAPASSRATLGTVIADLRHQTAKWELAIGDSNGQPAAPDRLIEMLQLLWQGQSRHAGAPNSRHQSQAESEATVHLAATVVQWLSSNVLRRKP